MAEEFLVAAVKQAVKLAREGRQVESFACYEALFSDPRFPGAAAADQRQALALLLNPKGSYEPAPEEGGAAHRAAWGVLSALVTATGEAKDHELLGLCHLRMGDRAGAKQLFEAGLAIAHGRGETELAGSLLKRISFL